MKNLQGLTIALGQIAVVPGRPDINGKRIVDESIAAAGRGVDIIVFPEMAVPGYMLGDQFEDDAFVSDVAAMNHDIARQLTGYEIVCIFGSVALGGGKKGRDGRVRKYNAAFAAHKGRLSHSTWLPFTMKTLHPNYRIFDDSRHFISSEQVLSEFGKSLTEYPGVARENLPVEYLLYPVKVTIRFQVYRVGLMLCEDMWEDDYPVSPGAILKQNGADILINLSCSPWTWRKNAKRHQVVRSLIARTGLPFVYVNNVGCQNNGKNFIPFDGSSTIYDEAGNIVALGEPYVDRVVDVTLKEHMPVLTEPAIDDVKQLSDAVDCGLRGFLETLPSHLRKAVIGLSGGVDSAVVAAKLVERLGADKVIAINLPYGDYNSAETKDNARQTAERLGITYLTLPITEQVDLKARQLGIEAGSSQFKTLMAIERMTTLANYASLVGAFFTSNANKTETAFGYSTLNGDGRGTFAPLGDLTKGEVYQLGHYLNTVVFKREVIPQTVFDIAPMDELSKGEARSDPFDYGRVRSDGTLRRGYHDEMVRAFVCFRKNPEWFLDEYLKGTLEQSLLLPEGKLNSLFASAADFVADLERCFKLFHGAIFKRVQSVPNVLVSKRAFGWDFRESVLPAHFTSHYHELKCELEERVATER